MLLEIKKKINFTSKLNVKYLKKMKKTNTFIINVIIVVVLV